MKKTVNVNVGGYAFIIEEDAYASLQQYMDAIAAACDGKEGKEEIVDDIESRIGDILHESRGGSEVVTCAMVDLAKSRIGDAATLVEDAAPAAEIPAGTVEVRRHLYRDIDNRNIGGVCSGIAAFAGIDPVWMRLVFAIPLIGGLFVWDANPTLIVGLLYLILWVCIPAARTVEQKCALKGQPVHLSEYRNYVPQSAPRTSVRRSPFLSVLGIVVGFLLLFTGGCTIMGSVAVPFVTGIMERADIKAEIFSEGPDAAAIYENLLLDRTFWWATFAVVFILGLMLCYAGVVLAFGAKRPSWRPGLVLFFAWIAALAVLVALSVKAVASSGIIV